MFLSGMFAYRSVLAGGMPMSIPDLRIAAQRDKWRNDTWCTDSVVAKDQLVFHIQKVIRSFRMKLIKGFMINGEITDSFN